MPRDIIIKVYKFNELSDNAKEKAREWFRMGSDEMEFVRAHINEDAETVGLIIESLSDNRANKGRFLASAEETAHKIEKEHGAPCETYKTAKEYLANRDRIINEHPRDTEGDFEHVSALDLSLDNLDAEFLHDILEDYRIMLEKEYEYQNSDEVVDETIVANEYEFTADGKRARC